MRFSLTIGLLLLVASPMLASNYYHGYRNSYGYTYHAPSGYWRWSDGTYWQQRYDRYGCLYYQQVYYYPPAPYVAPTQENYKEIVAKSLANSKAHDEFMEAMELAYPDYVGKKRRAADVPNLYGQTNTNIQVGSNLDVAVTMQGLERMAMFQQETVGAIGSDLLAIVKTKIAGDNENMRTLVQGIADAERLRAAQQPVVVNRNYAVGQVKGGPPVMPQAGDGPPVVVGPARAIYSFADLKQDCASCHSGAKTSGGFNVDAFLTLPLEKRVHIVHANIMGKEAKKAMPRGTDGAWHRLPDAKITAWFDLALTGKGG